MHLIVPFAAPLSEAGRQTLQGLSLPQLQKWLAATSDIALDEGDELTLSAPHERALHRALGWGEPVDGLVPLAQQAAHSAGLLTASSPGWGFLSPAHWSLGTEQVSLFDPDLLNLDEGASRECLALVAELFTSEGFELHYAAPSRWLCRHEALIELPTACLDRVVGRNVDRWLGADPRARLLRRLQNEVQMLLHEHPFNLRRESRGELPVNSVWLSGTGTLPATAGAAPVQVDERLRSAALNEDWPRWTEAWQALDAGPLSTLVEQARTGQPSCLTLCGERAAITWQAGAQSTGQRWLRGLGAMWRKPDVSATLERL